MKRPKLLLALAATMPAAAHAQLPTTPAPGPEAAPAPQASATATAEPGPSPGEQYFVDTVPPPTSSVRSPAPGPGVALFEPPIPPPPELAPPPPPEEPHFAPQSSFWLGARLGWFFPFGSAWARAVPVTTSAGSAYTLESVAWRDYVTSGPMLEMNVGLRFARSYSLFAVWERAQLGSGRASTDGEPDGAESDFWAVALRASSNPDELGFVTEVAIGYRRARSFYASGAEVQFTDAPFEARLGMGAELRLSRLAALSALVTVGVGGFGSVERVSPSGAATPLRRNFDQSDGHGWVTLTVGTHFDLVPSRL